MIKKQNLILLAVLTIITLGIYGIYWLYATRKQITGLNREPKSIPPLLVLFAPVALAVVLFFASLLAARLAGGQTSAAASALLILIVLLSLLAMLVITPWWFWRYCKALAGVSGESKGFFFAIWLMSALFGIVLIWMLVVQYHLNKLAGQPAVNNSPSPPGAAPPAPIPAAPTQAADAPPQQLAEQQRRKTPIAVIIIMILAGLVLVAGIVGLSIWLIGRDRQAGISPSVFNYIDGAAQIESADVTVSFSVEDTLLPALSGRLGRYDDGRLLGMEVSLDTSLVDREIARLQEIYGYRDLDVRADFSAGYNYQIDMTGLLGVAGISSRFDQAYMDFVEAHMSEQELDEGSIRSCRAAMEDYNKSLDEIVDSLQPSYEDTGNGESVWAIDTAPVVEKQKPLEDTANKRCDNSLDVNDRIPEGVILLLKTAKTGGDEIRFSANLAFGADLSDQSDPLLTARLTRINQAITEGNFSGPSLFDFYKAGLFVLAINRCGSLPVIATNAAASFSYVAPPDTPFDSSYQGPGPFDTAYFCTPEEAEAAGFNKSPL